jgi:Tfp pilus assembly protein PilN
MVDPAAELLQNQSWSAQQGLRWVSLAAALCLVGGLGLKVWAYNTEVQAHQAEAEMKTMQGSLAAPEASAVARELETLRQREASQKHMRDALMGAVSSSSFGYSDFLMALGRQTQPGLWITGLTVRGDGQDMALTGRMTDASALPQYLRRLQQEERFRGRRFAQLELRAVDGQEGVPEGITEFSLRGKLPDGNQKRVTP